MEQIKWTLLVCPECCSLIHLVKNKHWKNKPTWNKRLYTDDTKEHHNWILSPNILLTKKNKFHGKNTEQSQGNAQPSEFMCLGREQAQRVTEGRSGWMELELELDYKETNRRTKGFLNQSWKYGKEYLLRRWMAEHHITPRSSGKLSAGRPQRTSRSKFMAKLIDWEESQGASKIALWLNIFR